jgi:hypothetical protein
MATITFTIPAEKLDGLTDTFIWLWAIPQIEVDGEMVDEFTPNQWAKEGLRRWIIKQHKRHTDYLAKAQIDTAEDNDLLT